jgi:hypothetical protein
MHEEDGAVVEALKVPKVSEEGGDVSGGVFVDPVKPDEGVEDEELGA